MLGLPPGSDKAAIRKSYKKFVLMNHPDIKQYESPEEADEFKEKFGVITDAYKSIMKADEDLFWLEAFDARVREVNQKRRESWRRRQEQRMIMRMYKKAQAEAEARKAKAAAAAYAGEAVERAAPAEPAVEEKSDPTQLLAAGVLGIAGLVLIAFLSIVFSSLKG